MSPSVLVMWSLLFCAGPAEAGGKRMNVLFMASDDLRYQLGVSGPGVEGPGCSPGVEGSGCTKMVTPAIDRLAGMSLMLHKNYVQQAVCSPTRTSILTSRRPDATKVWDLYSYFRTVGGNYTTIPQLFKAHGYNVTGQGKIFHPGHASTPPGYNGPLHSKYGDDIEFSWSASYIHVSSEPYPIDNYGGPFSWMAVNESTEAQYPLSDTQIADSAIKQLEDARIQFEHDPDNTPPFFIAVGFHRPHLPFVAPQSKYDLYPADEVELPADQQPPTNMPPIAWSNSGELVSYGDINAIRNGNGFQPGQTLPPQTVKELRRGYYASVSYLDEQLGRVVDALGANGFLDNTVVSFWGDHGWQLGEHGEWCKHTNFELATRAPMMIRVPGLTDHGVATTMYTEHIDLMATLAEAAMGVIVPACPEGEAILTTETCTMGTSLVPLMSRPDVPVRNASFSQYPRGYMAGPDDVAVDDVGLGSQVGGTPKPSACLEGKCTMGYTVVTKVAGKEYRYTEWVAFGATEKHKPDWTKNVGTELYDHSVDIQENANLAGVKANAALVAELSGQLHRGPTTGGAWGPH